MHVHAFDLFKQVVEHVIVGFDPDPSGFYDLFDESLLALAASSTKYMSVSASSASQFR